MGAYTTFSTFTLETVRLAEEGAVNEAFRNVAASLVIGLAAAERRPRIGRCPVTPNRYLAPNQHVVNWHGNAARRVGEPLPSR